MRWNSRRSRISASCSRSKASSHAVQALDAWGLSYRAPLTAGVTVCRLHADEPWLDGTEIMFKGGQMGDVDVLERLIEG